MALTPGARIGSYEITAQIGVGGMGEVYRATDTSLGRAVAIKVLPDAVARDTERLARFDREARTLAALNHPHIAQIYGVERSDGTTALVMELVEGPTLADRIAEGPIPVDEALAIARQITEALEAAHEQGIIHRDLKPANVKVKPDGTVKVLDFGLAKAVDASPDAAPGSSMSPTITTPAMTQAGMILGTAAYMSPEQAKGRPVDKRSDIWAFGAVLFEMLTGKRAFEGADVSDVMGAVLRLEPQWTALPRDVPLPVQTLLRGCLVKESRRRVGDIAAARFVLDQAANLAAPVTTEASVPRMAAPWWRALPWAAAGAVVAGLSVWLVTASGSQPSTGGGRFVLSAPPSAALAPASVAKDVAISPDGAWVAYTAGAPAQLYLRAVDALEGTLVRDTEGATNPFFSPDGNWIGFNTLNFLKRVSLQGGSPQTISSTVGGFRGASWSSDGTIVVATIVGLSRIPVASRDEPVALSPSSSESALVRFWPEVLPGGRAMLVTGIGGGDRNRTVDLLDLDTLEERELFPGTSPRYSPTGHIVYGLDGTLMAVPFDLGRLEVNGEPTPIVDDVMTKPSGAVNFDLASNGSLVYVSGSGDLGEVVWVNRDGAATPVPGLPRTTYRDVRVSPDGRQVAIATLDDISIYDIERATFSRLTTDPANDRSPLWFPDGSRVVFTSDRGGFPELYWRAADGTGTAERLISRPETLIDLRAHDWSRDGGDLLFGEVTTQIECNFGEIAIADGSEVAGAPPNTFCNDYAAVSPDGRWVAYSSSSSGRPQIFVGRYPDLSSRKQASQVGGDLPLWSKTGDELFFTSLDARQMLSVAVRFPSEPEGELDMDQPTVLFERAHVPVATGWRPYDLAPDGRFVMITTPIAAAGLNVVLVQNFFDELKRRVPAE